MREITQEDSNEFMKMIQDFSKTNGLFEITICSAIPFQKGRPCFLLCMKDTVLVVEIQGGPYLEEKMFNIYEQHRWRDGNIFHTLNTCVEEFGYDLIREVLKQFNNVAMERFLHPMKK